MKNRLLMSAPLMTVLLVTSVLAMSGAFSLRGAGGDINYIGSDNSFSFEKVSFSAYVSPGSTGTGQGSIILRAVTTDGENIQLGVSMKNAIVELDNANTLKVTSDGYYYQRVKTWNGFWTTEKVEGKVTYTYNKNTGLTTVLGHSGLNFKVTGIPTVNLK